MNRIEPAAFGRLCVETPRIISNSPGLRSAAFGRLCVETANDERLWHAWRDQPPSGDCVLKPLSYVGKIINICQPPSDGCVLKLGKGFFEIRWVGWPAAFGRLCVETNEPKTQHHAWKPAAFGRLHIYASLLISFRRP